MPLEMLRSELDRRATLSVEVNRLARRFKVSTLVVLRRIHDVGQLSHDQLWAAYDARTHPTAQIANE